MRMKRIISKYFIIAKDTMRIELHDINVKEQIKDFDQYLETTDRIILSAKFGDGKTYFLNQLRKSKELEEKYQFITIYPVDYSVAKNEDIFEYIKRDIIMQLDRDGLLNNIDINALFDSIFDFSDLQAIVSFLLSFIPAGGFYDKVFAKFCEKKNQYKKKKHTSDKYLSSFSQIRGGIYENDGYTELIKCALNWMKEDHATNGPEWKKKRVVLIVEDLDRLDPKHLFRILNVLSAHIDDTSSPDVVTNKFGFNNIILVMDYESTEHIFHHFYGKEACYEGYMSKFLSREPFRYSIQHSIASHIENEFSQKLDIAHIFPTFSNFWRGIYQLSIRDLKRLTLFDIQDRIKSDIFEHHNMKFSTSMPLFHLIVYMVECGLSIDEIVNDLKTQITLREKREMSILCPEYMQLTYPLYAIAKNMSISYFSFGTEHFFISEKKDNNVITEVEVGPANSWDNSEIKIDGMNIEEVVRWCLSGFSTCLNLAALGDLQ